MSDRLIRKDDGFWYFRIRGNATMGPYSTYREAHASLERYVESCRRQSELSSRWPRWLHVKALLRLLKTSPQTTRPAPRRV